MIHGQMQKMVNAARIYQNEGRVYLELCGRQHSFELSKGWRYILELLQHPGKSYYAGTLYNAQRDISEEYRYLATAGESYREEMSLYSGIFFPPIPLSDDRTVREVSGRLNQLIAREVQLRENCDLGALDDLLQEKEILVQYLREVLSPEGKIRSYRDANHRQIRAVNKAIRRALHQISEVEAEFGMYLKGCINMWQCLCYNPREMQLEVGNSNTDGMDIADLHG